MSQTDAVYARAGLAVITPPTARGIAVHIVNVELAGSDKTHLWQNRPSPSCFEIVRWTQTVRDRQPGAVMPESKCSFVQPTKRQARRIGKVCGDSDSVCRLRKGR